jgi:outer membrane protein
MNRRLLVALTSSSASLSVILIAAGCRSHSERYGLPELGMSQQRIHTIEPFQLRQAEPNEAAPEPNLPPPEKIELSLEQSRAMALENNLQLKASLISPAIAEAELSAEEAKFESVFFANANFAKTDLPVGILAEVGDTGVYIPTIGASKSERLNTDFGVQMPLRTGGTLTFDLGDAQTKDMVSGSSSYSNTLSASLSQPLLRDAGRRVSMYSIRIATYNRDIVNARTKLDIIAVLAALDRVYWRLYAARKELEVRRQQYDLAQAQLERAQRLVEGGQRAQIEVVRAQAGVAQQLEGIIIAENSLRDRERELKRVIHAANLDVETPTVVVPSTLPDPLRYMLDRPKLVAAALEGRMELLELELLLLQDASTVDFSRNQTLPLVTLGYTYNINGTGMTRSDSLDLLIDHDFIDHRIGLRAVVPIGNEAAKSRLRQAIYARRQRLATRANREDLIRLEVLNAADQVEANWQRILAARQNTIVNARLYEAEQREFEVGMSTGTDLLNAQFDLANAQLSEISALTEYQVALVDLAYATGTVLGAAKIEWAPVVPEAGAE